MDRVVKQQLDHLADRDRRCLAAIVALAIDQRLHVECGDVLQQLVSERRIDFTLQVAKDLSRVLGLRTTCSR